MHDNVMKRYKLQTYIFALIIVAGIISMSLMSVFVIYKNRNKAEDRVQNAITVVHERLGWQLLRVENRLDSENRFPDFGLWQHTGHFEGLCIQYSSYRRYSSRSWCNGAAIEQDWPHWFESVYRQLQPHPVLYQRDLHYGDRVYGMIEVSLDPTAEIEHIWNDTQRLVIFMLISVCLTCLLVLFLLKRMLSTLGATHAGLSVMVEGQLSHRIPSSRVVEWHQLNQGINDLAAQLDSTLEQRNLLLIKMLNLQDGERRHICRELHDEFGQALTGLSAITQSLSRSTEPMNDTSREKLGQIQDISRHLKQSLQHLLLDLRPGLLDEMSLEESLKKLVVQWNQQQNDVFFELFYQSPSTALPSAIADNLFRIVQECLTNTLKHSGAGYAAIRVTETETPEHRWCLSFIDDGNVRLEALSCAAAFANEHSGQGLLGIQERVTLMNGTLQTRVSSLGGLELDVYIPIARHQPEP